MKIQEACLPCLVSLGVRCAALIPAASRPAFYRAFFHTLAKLKIFFNRVAEQLRGMAQITDQPADLRVVERPRP